MAIGPITNAFLSVNGVDLSDHVSKITIDDNRDTVDITAMGAVNKVVTKGLGDGKITVDFFQDFASNKVHQTLQPLIGSTTPFTVEARPVNAARSATNPGIVMSALLFNYSALDASVGAASTISAEFDNAAQAGITYPTS